MWSSKLDEWRIAFNQQQNQAPQANANADATNETTVMEDVAFPAQEVTPPSVATANEFLPTQRPSRGDYFTWERQLLRYMWQVKLETLQHQHVGRDERSLLHDMLVQDHVAAIVACVLHELRVSRGIACNGPTTANVRNWFKKRANPESWDKPYHPRHYKAYVRQQALDLAPPDEEEEEKNDMRDNLDEQVHVGQRLSFLKLLQQAVPLSSPQDILRMEDVHYFVTRMHTLLEEARVTGRVQLPLEQRTRVRAGAGQTSGVFSERVLRLLLEAYHQEDAARTWMSYSNPSDPTQLRQLARLRECINSQTTPNYGIESRASHTNWFRRPIINRIDDVQQIIKWTRRRLALKAQTERANANTVSTDIATVGEVGEGFARTWLELAHKDDQMLQHCRMMLQFVGRPLCTLILPYILADTNAMVSPAHPLSATLRFLWQVPQRVQSEHPLPRTLGEAQTTQTKMRTLSGAHLVDLARAWSLSCLELQGDEDQLRAWGELFVQLHQQDVGMRAQDRWCAETLLGQARVWLESHGAASIVKPDSSGRAPSDILHWCGLRAAVVCGCQTISDSPCTARMCTHVAHETAWRRLQRIVFWLELVTFLTRHGDALALIWRRVLVQKNVDVPRDASERKTIATAKPRKDLVLRAFMQLIDEWLWRSLSPSERVLGLQLLAYGFLMHLEFFAGVVTHLLQVNQSKSAAHLPHFGLTLEMCASSVFKWLLVQSGFSDARVVVGDNDSEIPGADEDNVVAAEQHFDKPVVLGNQAADDVQQIAVHPVAAAAATQTPAPVVRPPAPKSNRLFADNEALFAGLLGDLAPTKKT